MNHAYVLTRKWLRPGPLDVLIRELVHEKWGAALVVRMEGEQHWVVTDGADVPKVGLQIWIETRRKLEMRKIHGDLSRFLQTYLQENLAARLGGRCGDFGVSERWDPEPEKFSTFEKWWRFFNASPGHLQFTSPAEVERRLKFWLDRLPPELRGDAR